MHEMGIAEQILHQVEIQAEKHQVSRIVAITLRIGQYSGIEPRSLLFCLEAIRSQSVLANAAIQWGEHEYELHCPECGTSVVEEGQQTCPRCGCIGEARLPTGIYIQELLCDGNDDKIGPKGL